MSLPCIDPNPDITGVGICASIYGFPEYQLLCSSWMANVNEADTLEAISSGILLTVCALLVSPFIQVVTFRLRVYCALVVLNLSWINNVGLSGFALIESQSQGEKRKEGKFTLKHLLVEVWFHKDFSHHVRWPLLPFGFGL
jgi:hypothetical protein